MSLSLPNGSSFAIGTLDSTSWTMSALSNASEAVATLDSSHTIAVGDPFVINSGWGALDGRIAEADSVSGTQVKFDGINTANTTTYPAGSGTGSVTEIVSWTQITQVLGMTTSGGDPRFYTYQYLDAQNERQVPTGNSAQGLTLELADDQSLPWYTKLDAADVAGTPFPIRITLPSGAIIYRNCYVSFNRTPRMNVNQAMVLTVTLSDCADVTRYAS